MNPQADPLANLRPIILPAEPGWWPLAPGWWLVIVASLLALFALGIWLWRRHQARAPWREAQPLLHRIEQLDNPAHQLQQLHQLLRRAARVRHGASSAALAGDRWADFLAQTAPAELQHEDWRQFAHLPYRPTMVERTGHWLALGKAWLRHNLPC